MKIQLTPRNSFHQTFPDPLTVLGHRRSRTQGRQTNSFPSIFPNALLLCFIIFHFTNKRIF